MPRPLPAPLSLDVSYPTLINVVSDIEGTCEAYDVECDVDVAQSASDERRWRVRLSVSFNAKGAAVAAHKGQVTYVGIFTVVPEYPLEKMPKLVAVTAPSLLYSAIRELVALLTGRGPLRTVQLPAVSFLDNILVANPEAATVTHATPVPGGRRRTRKAQPHRIKAKSANK